MCWRSVGLRVRRNPSSCIIRARSTRRIGFRCTVELGSDPKKGDRANARLAARIFRCVFPKTPLQREDYMKKFWIRAFLMSTTLALVGVGCGKDNAPEKPSNPSPAPKVETPAEKIQEDPEVVAYFTKMQWRTHRLKRDHDGRESTFLTIKNPEGPFDEVKLTPENYKMIARSKTVQVIDMRYGHLDDEALGILGTMPRLESIDAHCEKVTDAGLKVFAKNRKLELLFLFAPEKITD